MLRNNHALDLKVNGESLDLAKDFNITMNCTLFDPKELSTNQAEYSYEATIPATKKNNRILDYANCLDKPNRFHNRWHAELYADEQIIFDGSMVINSFKDNEYSINLVSAKVYDLDDIFGDAVLTDIPWFLPFSGATSINEYNYSGNSEAMFPLVCYGAFQKAPYYKDEVANDYTSKYLFDKWNRWYIESFYPSLNMLSFMKKAFEWKGYIVGGDALSDKDLRDVYMSTNLADEQVPTYNLGNPLLGEVELTASITTSGSGYEQELQFPYFHVKNPRAGFNAAENVELSTKLYEAWNFQAVRIYDIMKSGSTTVNNSYMYDPNEKIIVIPADGWYKIELGVDTRLNFTDTSITVSQNVITYDGSGNDIEETNVTVPIGIDEITPIEIQLIRNYEDNVELIKGKWNKEYANGNPSETAYTVNNRHYNNINEWRTCFPHEDPYNSDLPTKKNELTLRNTQSKFGGKRTSDGSGGGKVTRGGSRTNPDDNSGFGSNRYADDGKNRVYNYSMFGYAPRDTETMCYDPAVNDGFLCGFSSLGKFGQPSIIKNGYSWSSSYADLSEAFYNQNGYMKMFINAEDTSDVEESATTFNRNEYSGAPATSFSTSSTIINGKMVKTAMYGSLACCVYLHKNDVLELFEIHRAYATTAGTNVDYSTTTNVRLNIKAMSPRSMAFLLNEGFNYDSPTEFDYDLRLSNFMNSETTVASYIQSLLDAFNLQMSQEGNSIFINKRKNPLNNMFPPTVDLDDRVNSNDAESESIDFPSSIAVRYKIDTDEWGFEHSVPPEKMNDDDWKDYGDSGFTIVQISDDIYNTDKQEKSLQFSYTWYDDFTWMEVDSEDNENSGNTLSLSLPVISKFQYMVDGYDYDESMKHDGYSLAQRFWMKPRHTDAFVWLDSYPTEKVDIFIPSNYTDTFVLNYKKEYNSILNKFFNSSLNLSSNKVKLDAYLTIDEYNLIKKGARIKFDKSVYVPTEINYNPTGENPSEVIMIKQ